jgi:hypothetical protein
VLEKRNYEESRIADALLAVEEKVMPTKSIQKTALSPQRPRRRRATEGRRMRGRPSLTGGILDLSWKDGGTVYPKRSSQIGDEYQAAEIPDVGLVGEGTPSSD